jgi:hypothetical protein
MSLANDLLPRVGEAVEEVPSPGIRFAGERAVIVMPAAPA